VAATTAGLPRRGGGLSHPSAAYALLRNRLTSQQALVCRRIVCSKWTLRKWASSKLASCLPSAADRSRVQEGVEAEIQVGRGRKSRGRILAYGQVAGDQYNFYDFAEEHPACGIFFLAKSPLSRAPVPMLLSVK